MAAKKDFYIVDAHLHLFPTARASRGMRSIQTQYGTPGLATDSPGLIEDALKFMDKGNIAKGIILPLMPVMQMRHRRVSQLQKDLTDKERAQAEREIDELLIGRIQRQNRWSCGVARENPRFAGCIIVDPIMGPDLMRKEIKDCVKLGAKGVGELVPDMMGWSIDGVNANDPVLWPIWETAIELGIPTVCHFGPSHGHVVTQTAVPMYCVEWYDEVLAKFPKLKLVELHMNVSHDDRWPYLYKPTLEAGRAFAKRHPNIICDISANLGYGVPIEDFVETVRQIGAERMIWGSDFLWIDPAKEVETILACDLTDREKRLLLGENAVKFFDLKK